MGIDLGTTYSCVGIDQNGRVENIANNKGKQTTPSHVAFTDKEILVVDAAKNQLVQKPENTVFEPRNQTSVLRRLPLRVVEVRLARDGRVLDRPSHERLRHLPRCRQNHRRDLRREPLRLPLELNLDQRLVPVALHNIEPSVLQVLLDNRV